MVNVRDLTTTASQIEYELRSLLTQKEEENSVDIVEKHFMLLDFLNTGRPIEWWKPSFFCFQIFRFYQRHNHHRAMRWHARAGRLYVRGW